MKSYILQTSKGEIEIPKCSKKNIQDVNEKLIKLGVYDYSLENDDCYIYDGDLTLDALDTISFTEYEIVTLIITGNLTVKEPLMEPDYGLIVFGKTTFNALELLDDSPEMYLLGGVNFNVAILSQRDGFSKEFRDLNGPFIYTNSDSNLFKNIENVKCFVDDYSFSNSHGKKEGILKSKYFDDDYIDAESIAKDIKFGEFEFKNKALAASFVSVVKPDFKDRKNIIRLLKEDADYFEKLDQEYRADKELINIAVETREDSFQFIADDLKKDRDYIFSMVKENGRLFQYIKKEFREDREMLLAAVKNNGYAIADANNKFKADKEIALLAVNDKPAVLEYLKGGLKADEDILIAVIHKDVDAFKYASKKILSNEKVILELVTTCPEYIEHSKLSKYRKNKAFITRAIVINPRLFIYLDSKMQKDEDVITALKSGENNSLIAEILEISNDLNKSI